MLNCSTVQQLNVNCQPIKLFFVRKLLAHERVGITAFIAVINPQCRIYETPRNNKKDFAADKQFGQMPDVTAAEKLHALKEEHKHIDTVQSEKDG